MRKVEFIPPSLMAVLLAIIGITLLACSPAHSARGVKPRPAITPPGPSTPAPQVTTPTQLLTVNPKLTSANTQFGFKLFNQVLQEEGDQNVFVSPTSVAIALSMLYNGANGTTQAAMAEALQLNGLTLADLNQENANLKALLTNPEPQVQLTIANSLWAKQGIPFKPDFLERNQTFYGAKVTELDFNAPEAAKTINAWVNENTQGKIPTIIDRIKPNDVMFLINAIYFNGKWAKEFDQKLTTEQPFYLLNGTQKQHPLMSQTDRYPYYETEQFQAVSLPYGSGRLSLYIFLPKPNSSLAEFQKTLTAENWQTWMTQFRKKEGTVNVPKFKLEYEVELKQALAVLGMGIAFNPSQADFSNLRAVTTDNAYVSQVKHKTFVEVNEVGTEAAAVTSVTVTVTSVMIDGPFRMTVDRPFFFVIRDNQTESVLFMGSMVDPKI